MKEPQEILEILEAPSEAAATEEPAAETVVEGVKEEQPAQTEATAPEEQSQPEEEETETEYISPMLDNLKKDLEETVATLPSGQLSEEQKKLFAYFTSVRGMNQQLAALLEEDRMRKERRDDSLLGNIVITGESGPDHNKTFEVEVHLNSNVIGKGKGGSKKSAEQAAAREALKLMGVI